MFRYCFLLVLIVGLGYQSLDPNNTHDYLNRANANVPNDATSYYNRGIDKFAREDYTGAIQDYTQAITLDPNYTEAYNGRGDAKWWLEDYTGAIRDYTQAIIS